MENSVTHSKAIRGYFPAEKLLDTYVDRDLNLGSAMYEVRVKAK